MVYPNTLKNHWYMWWLETFLNNWYEQVMQWTMIYWILFPHLFRSVRPVVTCKAWTHACAGCETKFANNLFFPSGRHAATIERCDKWRFSKQLNWWHHKCFLFSVWPFFTRFDLKWVTCDTKWIQRCCLSTRSEYIISVAYSLFLHVCSWRQVLYRL